MNVNGLMFALVNAAAFMLSAGFLMYVTLIVIPFLRYKPAEPGDGSLFYWHFVVPCRDEEAVIEQTVTQLRQDFPAAHVWCVDDASADATPHILRRLARADRRVHVVTRRLPNARLGKGPALNAAWQAICDWLPSGVDPALAVLGVVDADGVLDPGCLDAVSGPKYFANPDVSAVQIEVRVSNDDPEWHQSRASRLLVRLQDLEFTTVIAAIQMLRRNLGSVGMGGNGQFTRLSALNLLAAEHGEPWGNALIEDFELGLRVLLSGGRNEYCHESWVRQQGPPTFPSLVRQRSRWGQGVMQCTSYFKPVLTSPKIATSGAVEITYFLTLPWMQIIGDLVYILALVSLGYEAFSGPKGPLNWLGVDGAWQIIPLFAMFGVAPLFVWGPIYRRRVDPGMSRLRAVGLGALNWPYILVHHSAVWWAFLRMVRSQHDWKKTARLDHRSADLLRAQALRVGPGLSAGLVIAGRLRVTTPEARAEAHIRSQPTKWHLSLSPRNPPEHHTVKGRFVNKV